MCFTCKICKRRNIRNGAAMANENSQIAPITASVRCLVTRDRSGNMIAIVRSHEIADNVSTDEVKHVTDNRQLEID